MRTKTFDQPHSHDREWYRDRELADHIHQSDHRPRLLEARRALLEILTPEDTVCDFGCGNGGLLRELEIPNETWGYDLQPSNVSDAISKGSKNVSYHDFINEDCRYPSIAICTEVLEHLVDPDAFIKKLKDNGVRAIIASSPAYETPEFHAPFHLWVFQGTSYADMFTDAGWENVKHYHFDRFQFVIAQ